MINKEEQTILLIEDNPGDSRLIEEMLKEITSFNYTLIIAETLKDGCEQIKKYKFILILLDLNLPDSTGKQTFDTVIKCSEKIPVVLVSGLNDVELSLSLIKEGAQDYILKQDLNSNLLGKTIQYALIRKKAEEELKASENHAQESDRLKSAFLANMSHEIRTPMNGILGFAELLKEPGLTGEEQQEYIRIIEKSGARMLNIINDIVDISKIEAGLVTANLRDVNINGKIEFVYKFFKPEIEEKGIQLFFKNGLPNVNAILHTDEEKLYAILINLVKNAAKYTDSGLIEIGYKLVNKDIKMPLIEFYVKDSGIGIPKDRQNAIFERFIQADISDAKAYQGAGLGLSISKAYVEMLGGTIWVESEFGKGSTFHFTIPYYRVTEKNPLKPDAMIILQNPSVQHNYML
jgi:signal transduction histidine kinase